MNVPLSASERQSGWVLGDAAPELRVHFGNTLSIFRMIRSAHWTAAATSYSVIRVGTAVKQIVLGFQLSPHAAEIEFPPTRARYYETHTLTREHMRDPRQHQIPRN